MARFVIADQRSSTHTPTRPARFRPSRFRMSEAQHIQVAQYTIPMRCGVHFVSSAPRPLLKTFFHAWERRLADVTKDRVVRPFNWGLDWISQNGHPPGSAAADVVSDWVSHVMADT